MNSTPLPPIDSSRVRAVTFDVGGTLLHPHPSVGAVYAEILARHHVHLAPEILESRFRQAFANLRAHPRPLINEATELAFWREIVHRSITPECPPHLIELIFSELWDEFSRAHRWQPLPHAPELLAGLARSPRRLTLAVFSNWDSRLRLVLDELHWTPHFHHHFISSEMGFEKPDRAAFRAVERALALPSAAILHVGDSFSHDCQPALAAGWQTVLISSEPLAADPSFPRITCLHQLLPLLA